MALFDHRSCLILSYSLLNDNNDDDDDINDDDSDNDDDCTYSY
jgi:hypothetical protein